MRVFLYVIEGAGYFTASAYGAVLPGNGYGTGIVAFLAEKVEFKNTGYALRADRKGFPGGVSAKTGPMDAFRRSPLCLCDFCTRFTASMQFCSIAMCERRGCHLPYHQSLITATVACHAVRSCRTHGSQTCMYGMV